MLTIERSCFSDAWSKKELLEDRGLVATVKNSIVGFLIWRETFAGSESEPREREILNVAVHPEWLRCGIAKALLTKHLEASGDYFLEVRESNIAARTLYQHLGFVEVGKRSNYYRAPKETAIVMYLKRC